MRALLASLYVLAAVAWLPAPAMAVGGRFEAQGAELILHIDDGRTLRGDALVGLHLIVGGGDGDVEVRIDGVEEDAAATGGPIPLYRLTPASGDGPSGGLCQPDSRGRRAGFPIPDGAGGFRFTCTSGAEGKCVLMGYRPWETRDGVPLRDLHQACIHMLRADYGGDDRPTTRDGTLVDIYDKFGIQKPDRTPGMAFEAAWGASGAICVAHPRIPEHVSLDDLAERYPRLAGRLGPELCTENAVEANPLALLFNRSAVPHTTAK